MLYRDIDELWAEIADDVEGYQATAFAALMFFIITAPLWFPVWLISKIKNKFF
jgi:hypothetical protein